MGHPLEKATLCPNIQSDVKLDLISNERLLLAYVHESGKVDNYIGVKEVGGK